MRKQIRNVYNNLIKSRNFLAFCERVPSDAAAKPMADARAYFHRSDRVQRSFFIGNTETNNKVQAFTVVAMTAV